MDRGCIHVQALQLNFYKIVYICMPGSPFLIVPYYKKTQSHMCLPRKSCRSQALKLASYVRPIYLTYDMRKREDRWLLMAFCFS
jgi:hypothetical protein